MQNQSMATNKLVNAFALRGESQAQIDDKSFYTAKDQSVFAGTRPVTINLDEEGAITKEYKYSDAEMNNKLSTSVKLL